MHSEEVGFELRFKSGNRVVDGDVGDNDGSGDGDYDCVSFMLHSILLCHTIPTVCYSATPISTFHSSERQTVPQSNLCLKFRFAKFIEQHTIIQSNCGLP